MRIVGLLMAVAGWLISVVGLSLTSSLSGRFILVVLGIAVSLIGILGVLNKAHLKNVIWKV